MEFDGIQIGEHAAEGVMRRYPVGKIKKLGEPSAANRGKFDHCLIFIGAGDGGTEGNDDDIDKRMDDFALVTARIREISEEASDGNLGKRGWLRHISPP